MLALTLRSGLHRHYSCWWFQFVLLFGGYLAWLWCVQVGWAMWWRLMKAEAVGVHEFESWVTKAAAAVVRLARAAVMEVAAVRSKARV